jgi:hypothetical protein
MSKLSSSLLFFFLIQINLLSAQNGCPGCLVNLPPLPADTIYLGTAPDGIAGEAYNGDLSFRMPKSTTPVHEIDPGTPAGLNIGKITIIALLNVPPGLYWEPNKFEFDPGNETDGCVKFCGTPLIPGMYEVQVFVTAEVLTINQSTSFTFSFYIAPSTSMTDGFSMQNSNGCGDVTVSFENNIMSNGDSGFDYFWDFGNGETSTEENPGEITYSNPGTYVVNYEAIIDTSGYELSTVQIVAAGCNDISIPPISNAPPELYIKIKNPAGNQIYQSPQINNAPLPSAFNVNIPLGPGNYSIEVRDDDLIGSDHCGTVTFNRNSTDTLKDGSLRVLMNIFHPVFSVQSTDTVYVYDVPAPPIVSPNGLIEVCSGESVELVANYQENLQWYKDSSAILGAIEPSFTVSSDGIYWVEYTTPEGCTSISEPIEYQVLPTPPIPAFNEDGNWLSLNDTTALPNDYSLQWYINGDAIPDAVETNYCNTTSGVNLFSLVVTDNETGCTNEFSIGVAFDENADCTVPTEEILAIDNSLRIFPNPTNQLLNIAFENETIKMVELVISDVMGRYLYKEKIQLYFGDLSEAIDVSKLKSGVYFIEIKTDKGHIVRKFIKN